MKQYGAWALVHELGHGAAGVVYLARNAAGELAAVKVCLREKLGNERYEREARGAKLYRTIPPTEGLIRQLDFEECEWGFYTVMELADEEFGARPSGTSEYHPKTLSRVIAGEKALPLKEALQLGLALAKGLATLQRHHFLHRDIKPGNVVYVRSRPVLADPGLLVDEAEAASLVGTPGYVPPENFVGASGDIYSLGLTLKAASFGRTVDELERGPTLEADTGHPLFAAWWRILNKATDPDAARRYRSAKALMKDLQALRRRMVLAVFTRKWMIVLGLVSLVALIALGVSSFKSKQGIDELIEKRVKEDMPDIKRGIESLNKDLMQLKEMK